MQVKTMSSEGSGSSRATCIRQPAKRSKLRHGGRQVTKVVPDAAQKRSRGASLHQLTQSLLETTRPSQTQGGAQDEKDPDAKAHGEKRPTGICI